MGFERQNPRRKPTLADKQEATDEPHNQATDKPKPRPTPKDHPAVAGGLIRL
ncbi:MAG TPA: hypothetical protein VH306_05295 [Gaiellaceae bacterium]